ncbi:hypothetical protein PC128_g18977 [Phytophthora cactorum]|nr:hypothetical protein PC128_g18977 [Phytophthora cactorum]
MVAARLAPVEYLYAHGGLAYEQMKIVEAKPVQRCSSTRSGREFDEQESVGSLNSASGHKSKALGVIDFPVKLGAAEKELSFTLTDNLHVNFKLGTANLGTFRTVIDHEMRTMMLKDMAEVLQLGDTRVNETYGIGVASSEQLLPGQQAPVEMHLTVARMLFTVQNGQVLVKVCNASTEEAVHQDHRLTARRCICAFSREWLSLP